MRNNLRILTLCAIFRFAQLHKVTVFFGEYSAKNRIRQSKIEFTGCIFLKTGTHPVCLLNSYYNNKRDVINIFVFLPILSIKRTIINHFILENGVGLNRLCCSFNNIYLLNIERV